MPQSDKSAISPPGYPNFRFNYILGITNGVLFNTGLSFFNRTTVIPVFLAALGAPSILIALTALFEVLGWHLPQLIASKFIVHKSRKMPLYALAAVIRVTGLALATTSALYATSDPPTSLWLFVGGYGLFAVASGFGGIVFTEILAKTCPKEKRGSYFGWRAILSGIVGLYIGVNVIKPIFAHGEFPTTFLTVFVIGSSLIALSLWLFTMQKEPEQTDLPPRRSLVAHLAAAGKILRTDHRFRRFIAFRALMMLWFAGLPFYVLLAREQLGAKDGAIGVFTSWEFAGLIVANLAWGYISDRVGNRTLLIVGCALGAVVSAAVIAFATGAFSLPLWSFGAIFFLSAGVDSGVGTGGLNYALEIVPEAERPTYIGLMNSILALALAVAAIAGGLRDVYGYAGLYTLTGVVSLAALVLVLRLPEPRRNN